jgi:hypothetical protein
MLQAHAVDQLEVAVTAAAGAGADVAAATAAAATASAATTTTTTTTTATPRQSLAPLVARVRSCETAVALDSVIVAPEFSRPASLLTPEDSDQLQAEVKKRYAELESTA